MPGAERAGAAPRGGGWAGGKILLHPAGGAGRMVGHMSRFRRRLSASPWPFWLLIAAWGCANAPQAALYAGLAWLAEARSFTHQQRLTVEVAYLLGGDAARPERAGAIAATRTAATPKAPTAVPADAVLKKIVLALERGAEIRMPATARGLTSGEQTEAGGIGRAEPRLGPPRGRAV